MSDNFYVGWRSVYFSSEVGLKLRIYRGFLRLETKEAVWQVPLRDLDLVVIDAYNFVISNVVLSTLAKNNTALIITDPKKHLPVVYLTNPFTHSKRFQVLQAQLNLTEEEKIEIWKRILAAKITNRNKLVNTNIKSIEIYNELLNKLKSVKDKKSLLGIEGVYSKNYWKNLFIDIGEFKREQEGEDIENKFLNYAYAVIRSKVSANLTSFGLLPYFSIFHSASENSFALADDLIEAYRYVVEWYLIENYVEIVKHKDLTPNIKKDIVNLLHKKVTIHGKGIYTLSDAIRLGAESLQRAILKKDYKILENLINWVE